MLVLTRRKDEQVVIRQDIVITILSIQGGRVKLGIKAPEDVSIRRVELPPELAGTDVEIVRQ